MEGTETVKVDVLHRLPIGFRIVRFSEAKDMEGINRKTLLVVWTDRNFGKRYAHFCRETGEYITDTWGPEVR